MKILAILSTGGSLHGLRPEVEYFIEMHRMGIDIDVCTDLDTVYASIMKRNGMNIVGSFPKNKNDKKWIKDTRSLLIKNKYDIIHSLQRKAIACALKASKGLVVKNVVYRGASGLYWHDPSAYENALNPRVDKVICVCNDIRDNIRKQLFFKNDKAITIYKGHDTSWYDDIESVDRKQLGIEEDDFVIACTANNRKWKGIPTFLDAIDLLPSEVNIKILLIGGGMDSSYYLKKIATNKNTDKILSLGYRDDAMSIAKTSDVIMQTSYKNEGLSRSTIEGMNLGCAPIVTAAGGNPELVLDQECGLVVPIKNPQLMADAIMKLYNDRILLKAYQEASFERIKSEFTVRKTADETIAVYKSLLS